VDQDLVIRRRVITPADLVEIRQLIEVEGARGRSHLSNRLCDLWDWRQANGRYRAIACRELLRRLEAKGLIQLPPPLRAARRAGYRNATRLPELGDTVALAGSLAEFRSQLTLRLVREAVHARIFAGLIGAYHYLGYQQATGAQLKYLVWYADRPIACLSFGPAAWKLAPRDHYIGWSARARQARLDWVVNNDRFLIVPGVHIRHLASYVLAATLRRLRADWQAVYGHDLALAETFIEAGRFRGSCYAAAHWVCVGQTQGRGRNDRRFARALPLKTIWVHPLRADFRSVLSQEA
jgi:Druantia protein DruA